MVNRLTRILFFLTLALMTSAASAQQLGIKPYQFSKELRTHDFERMIPVPSLTAATDVTAGRDGVICAPTIDSDATPNCTTAELANIPHPCKLDVKVHDDSNADTLTCTSCTIAGSDQFGAVKTETFVPSAETVNETQNVYASLTAAGCSGCTDDAGDAGDVVRFSCSAEIGLPFKLDKTADVLTFCIWDVSASDYFCLPYSSLTIDMNNYSVETDNLTPTIGNGDVVYMRLLLGRKS